jgi:hypothetical protein
MATVKLRPGYLVSLKSKIEGGPKYTHKEIETDAPTDGPSVEKFMTTKVTEDPEEYARAVKVRGKARGIVQGMCIPSDFGLLCPTAKKNELDDAVREAKERASYFNATSKTCHVSIYVITGQIAESDNEASAAISSEMRGLMEEMQAGINETDVERIRAAASAAKKVGAMLDADTGRKVSAAVEEAREVAKQITKKLLAKGEDAAAFVQGIKLKAISEARFAFLDFEEPAKKPLGEQLSLPVVAPRGLDLETNDADDNSTAEVGSISASEADPSNDMKMVAGPMGDVRKLEL